VPSLRAGLVAREHSRCEICSVGAGGLRTEVRSEYMGNSLESDRQWLRNLVAAIEASTAGSTELPIPDIHSLLPRLTQHQPPRSAWSTARSSSPVMPSAKPNDHGGVFPTPNQARSGMTTPPRFISSHRSAHQAIMRTRSSQ